MVHSTRFSQLPIVLLLPLVLAVSTPAPAKTDGPPENLYHEFPSGQKIVFLMGANGSNGIFHVNNAEQPTMLEGRHPFFVGNVGGSQSATVTLTGQDSLNRGLTKLAPAINLAYAILGWDLLVITATGDHRSIPLLVHGLPNFYEMTVLDSAAFFDSKNREHLFLTYTVNSWTGQARAVLVDDQLRATSMQITRERAMDRSALIAELSAKMPTEPPPANAPVVADIATPVVASVKVGPALKDVTVPDNEGKTVSAIEFIKQFSTNLTEKFTAVPFSNQYVNWPKIRQISEALAGSEITSVAYLGYPGTGKTTDINMMVSEAANGRGPEFLRSYTFIAVKPGVLGSAAKYVGSTDTRIAALLALAKANDVIFVIDEIHSLQGLGTHSGRGHDITESLLDDMADGTLKIVGMSTENQFHGAGFSAPFRERFIPVMKVEPQGEELMKLLRGWVASRGLTDPGEALFFEALSIAERFAGLGAQPRKTTKLIDAVYARIKTSDNPSAVPSIELLHEVARERLGFDPGLINPKLALARIENMMAHLDRRIIGQVETRALIERATIRAFSGLGAASGPRLKIMLAGPEGQGKTSIGKAFAAGMGLPAQIIDMAQWPHGSNPGSGPLAHAAAAVAQNAFSVLIFDEIEKASLDVQEQLLQALESGRAAVPIMTKAGLITEMVDFRNTSVIFTSNAGADEIRGGTPGFFKFSRRAKDRELILRDGRISRYLLDRVEVALVGSLNAKEFRAAVELHLNDLFRRFTVNGTFVIFPEQDRFLDFAESLWREHLSNRRIVDMLRPIEDFLAQEKLTRGFPEGVLELKFDGRNLSLTGSPSLQSCEHLLEGI